MIGRVCVLLALVLWMPGRALAQNAPDMFKDVPRDNWTYDATNSLRARGILIGYPDSYFSGDRTLTRYEFAVALDRALHRALGEVRATPGAPASTAKGSQPALSSEDVATLRRLIAEFGAELLSLGRDLQDVSRRIDQVAHALALSRPISEQLPRLSSGAPTRIRSGFGSGSSGRLSAAGFSEPMPHELRLGLTTSLSGGSTLSGSLNPSANSNFLGGEFGRNSTMPRGLLLGPAVGQYPGSQNSPSALLSELDLLQIRAPFRGVGRGSSITIGRFNQDLAGGVESYLDMPSPDEGNTRINGARLSTKFGSLAVEAFGGQTNSIGAVGSGPINSPTAGRIVDSPGAQLLGTKAPSQLAGVSVGLGVRQLEGGHVRLSALELAGSRGMQSLGADVRLRLTDRLSLLGDWGKTIAHNGPADAANPQFNSAYNAAVRYDAGSLNLTAGYRFVDPDFYAPAYWGRIGGWLNPTNIAGPSVRAAWDITPRFAINVGGEMFSAARDRVTRGGLGENDTITRALVGIRWNLSRSLETTFDWEGVYWDLEGANSLTGGMAPSLLISGAGRSNSTEQYFTLGTGYRVTNNARLRFLYQIGTYDGKGLLLNGSGFGARNTFNLFTGQVAVRF